MFSTYIIQTTWAVHEDHPYVTSCVSCTVFSLERVLNQALKAKVKVQL